MNDRLFKAILALLRQGSTPNKVALCISLGAICGLFPIVGAATVLCAVAALALGLNQVGIQIVNFAVFPVQVGGIPLFVRLGEWIAGAPHAPLAPATLVHQLREDPEGFLRSFTLTGLHGVLGWAALAPFLALVLYVSSLSILRRAELQVRSSDD